MDSIAIDVETSQVKIWFSLVICSVILIIKDIILTTWKGEIQNLTKHKQLNTEFNFSFNIIMYKCIINVLG